MGIKSEMYNDSVSLLRTLSEKYDSCKDKNNFFIYLWDKKELSPSSFRVLYNNACSVLSIGTGASKEDMILLDKMDKVSLEYNDFYNSFFQKLTYYNVDNNKSDLYEMFDVINDFLAQKNSLYLLIYYLIDVKGISYKDMSCYNKKVNTYSIECLRGDIPDFKLKGVYNFNRAFSVYRGILKQPDYLAKLIQGADDKFIKFLLYVLKNNNVTVDALKKHLAKYSNDSLVCKFVSKYKKYCILCDKREEEKKQEDRVAVAYNTIRNYLDGTYYNLDCYCGRLNITKATFENYVSLMKETNNPIYDEYADFSLEQRRTKFINLLDKFHTMISLIQNGVIEDGEKRDFDILDYYSYTKLSFDEVKKIIKGNVSNAEYSVFSMFCSKYSDKPLDGKAIKEIFDSDVNFFCKISSEGEIVDTGYSVNEYDKQHVMNMLKSQKIPITSSTYSAMLNNYIDIKLDKKNTIKR